MKKKSIIRKPGMPSEVKKGIIVIVVVLVVLVAMYFLTVKILSKDTKDDKVTENSIQYDEIMAGESFNQNNDEYYVIYYDASNKYSNLSSLISSYQLNGTGIRLYSVDLSDGINKKYVTDGEIVTDDASSLRVKDQTLLKFSDNRVVEVVTDTNEITNILNAS